MLKSKEFNFVFFQKHFKGLEVIYWFQNSFLHYTTFTLKKQKHFLQSVNNRENFFNQQDSKELSPRSLDNILLKLQVNSQNVQNTQLSKFFKFSKFSKFLNCSKLKLCQILWNTHMTQNDAILSILY